MSSYVVTSEERAGDMASPVAIGRAVFQRGPHGVDVKHIDHSQVPSVPKSLMVVTPTDAGVYPVAVFLHGCSMYNSWYESLLSHVASHGFIAVDSRSASVVVLILVVAVPALHHVSVLFLSSENTSACMSSPRLITARRHHSAAQHERLE